LAMGIRVGVFGATGKMGQTICAGIGADPELDLVACVDPYGLGRTILGNEVAADPKAMVDAGVEVAIDFTVVDAARTNVAWCGLHGIHAVVGTTGFTDTDLETFRGTFTRSNCLIASNFTIGAVLMMKLAEMCSPYFETAEIIEYHHDTKADAPSGTAMATVKRMAEASDAWAADPTKHEIVPGARGGAADAGIRVHSVRMRGMFAHQEVILGTIGQTLTIRHDSFDRTAYNPGVLLACKQIAKHPGVTIGLDQLLFGA
jgi:4-hydroxy-tetrahydrodipicolinate reductase